MGADQLDDTWVPTYDVQCNTGPCLIKAHRVNGTVVGIQGNTEFQDRVSARPCLKSLALVHKLYNPNRVKSPLKRTNPKKGKEVDPGWVAISWDEALNIVAGKLKEIRAKGLLNETGYPRMAFSTGSDGIPSGTFGSLEAFIKAWGPTERTLRAASVKCIHDEHVLGEFWHKAFMNCADTPRCNWLLSCGHNTNASAGAPAFKRHGDARVRGMKIIQVEPHLSVTGATATEWIPIRPKTDSALLFAMIHVLLYELDWHKVCDLAFLKKMTNSPYLVKGDGLFLRDPDTGKPLVWDVVDGKAISYDSPVIKDLALEGSFDVNGTAAKPSFQLLRDQMAPYTPSWASTITGIDSETIRRLAREFAENAMVGAEVEIEGVKLPWRPVAIALGKSVNNGLGGYEAVWAQHVLQILVGALEVAGGLVGQFLVINPTPVKPDADGFIDHPVLPTDAQRWSWPPKGRDLWNILTPLMGREPGASGPFGVTHLAWYHLKNPPEALPRITPPDIWFTYRTNPAIAAWDSELVTEGIQQMPFHVSFAYELDETNHFADLILPENTDLESFFIFYIGGQRQWESFWEHFGVALRQPVVKPVYDTRDLTDIFTDLADRIGLLREYNEAINNGSVQRLRLKTGAFDYSLDVTRKHSASEIYDRICRAATMLLSDGKTENGLDWFKEHGAFIVPYSKIYGLTKANLYARPWYLHHDVQTKGLRYNLPYQERIKRVGVELGDRLHEKNIHFWDQQLVEFEALPTWHDPPLLYDTGAEYDLWLVACRSMQYSLGANVSLPLLFEAAERVLGHTGAMINKRSAEARGIKDGDLMWIESPRGRIKARAFLREGVHPEVIVTTQQFGHWKISFAKDLGWPNLNPVTPINYKTTNGMGSSSDHVKVKAYKA